MVNNPMIQTIGVLIIDGFEEIEAITIADVLRRAEFNVILIGVDGTDVTGSHGICVKTDRYIDNISAKELDALVLPGGMPGSANLANNQKVISLLQHISNEEKKIGAICAAPIALQSAGLLKGKKVTCYPAVEQQLPQSICTGEPVTVDGNIITGKGAGTALQFSLKLVEVFGKPERAVELKQQMVMIE